MPLSLRLPPPGIVGYNHGGAPAPIRSFVSRRHLRPCVMPVTTLPPSRTRGVRLGTHCSDAASCRVRAHALTGPPRIAAAKVPTTLISDDKKCESPVRLDVGRGLPVWTGLRLSGPSRS
jgi:hypothetical protein